MTAEAVCVINHSTLVNDAGLAGMVKACEYQLRRHVAADWAVTRPHVALGDDGSWPIVILDHADQAGALGYHATTPDGRPYGRVFVVDTRQAGVSLSSVLSHELAEAFIDPTANRWADDGTQWWALEVGDPVESTSYECQGITVSDYVTPAWFGLDTGGRCARVSTVQPFVLAPGGYAIVASSKGVRQVYGDLPTDRAKTFPAARTTRRGIGA